MRIPSDRVPSLSLESLSINFSFSKSLMMSYCCAILLIFLFSQMEANPKAIRLLKSTQNEGPYL